MNLYIKGKQRINETLKVILMRTFKINVNMDGTMQNALKILCKSR